MADDFGKGGRRDGLARGGLAAGPLLALLIVVLPPGGMEPAAWHMLAVTVWMVVWWLTEAVPIPATALLPLVLMPLLGIRSAGETASSYANPLIFLFLGGFLLSIAMQGAGLHRRLALRIVAAVGGSPGRMVLGFMLATAFLSMWISNTATAILMYAVALSVIAVAARRAGGGDTERGFGVALMLAVAYSASIGGVATLIGTPPNALLASFLAANHGIEIGFARWMMVGLPVALVMLPLAWLALTRLLFPQTLAAVPDASAVLAEEARALGPMSPAERMVAIVFALTATGWILRTPLAALTGLPLDDTMIAIAAALALFAIPVRGGGGPVLDWQAARSLPWDILILFGGGLALAGGFNDSGLAAVIGRAVSGLDLSPGLLMLAVVAAVVFLTEITSNTASTATLLPVMAAVAAGLGMDVMALALPVALGASMAFMMPVATPPNAIVFAYPQMGLRDMLRAGLLLNLAAIAVAYGAVRLLAPLVWGVTF